MLLDFLLILVSGLFRQINSRRTLNERKVMENLEQLTQGFEQEVHVHCKRSIGTLLFSFLVLIATSF